VVILINPFGDLLPDHERVRCMIATAQVQGLSEAVERYKKDCGDYPRGL